MFGEHEAGLLQRIALSMPARLAVGLGRKSGLDARYRESYAPPHTGEIGSPASGHQPDLDCNDFS